MDISLLVDKLQFAKNDQLRSILEIFIEAVADFPEESYDLDIYLGKIKDMLGGRDIDLEGLWKIHNGSTGHTDWWIQESASGLLGAFDIMKLYRIELKDVIDEVERLIALPNAE